MQIRQCKHRDTLNFFELNSNIKVRIFYYLYLYFSLNIKIMPTCPSGYSWINGQCVKNPGPNPPLVEDAVEPIEQEDVQEDQPEDED